MSLQETLEAVPAHSGAVGSAMQPLPPRTLDESFEGPERLPVPGDPVILVVTPHLQAQRLVLLFDRPVAEAAATA